jgi:hypothetical protein
MFGFLFKRKEREADGSAPSDSVPPLAGAENLSDKTLCELLTKLFDSQHPTFGALFLVAFANWQVDYVIMHQVVQLGRGYSHTLEGYARFLSDSLNNARMHDEAARRILFYKYLAALTQIATERARRRPEVWDDVAGIWVALLSGARALRSTIDRTALWGAKQTAEFKNVRTETDGENYCISMLAPREIRAHPKVIAWREKDLSPQERAEIQGIVDEAERLIRGD